ncbi:MAG: hypothetical protein JRG91_20195 [Deltaproteobacteria bacterium]|nr:hypothetical protein [Deltaproteobacteria bacterium]
MGKILCPSCGEALDPNTFMCPHCGYSLTSTPSTAPGPPRSYSSAPVSRPQSQPVSRTAMGGPAPVPGLPGAGMGGDGISRTPSGVPPGPASQPPVPKRPSMNPPGEDLGADDLECKSEGDAFTVSGVLEEAWGMFKSSPIELVVIFLVMAIVGAVAGFVPRVVGMGSTAGLVVSVTVMAVAGVAYLGLLGGAIVYWLKLIRDQDPSFADLGTGFRYIIPLVTTTLVTLLVVACGLALLVVPGVILCLGFCFVAHVVVDKNLGLVEAMKASWRITAGNRGELLLLALLCVLVMLLGSLMLGVGVFVATPVAFGAVTVAYHRLAEPGHGYVD